MGASRYRIGIKSGSFTIPRAEISARPVKQLEEKARRLFNNGAGRLEEIAEKVRQKDSAASPTVEYNIATK